ncbi:hypothetical protein J4438_01465 [Candidatus Woesearchaeota archaeon]|nr:hypothetical protein [Candidatus Woesearchaeota archaeon]
MGLLNLLGIETEQDNLQFAYIPRDNSMGKGIVEVQKYNSFTGEISIFYVRTISIGQLMEIQRAQGNI